MLKETAFDITDEMYDRFKKAYEPFDGEEILKLLFDAQIDLASMLGMFLYFLQNQGDLSNLCDDDYDKMQKKIQKLQHNRKVFLNVLTKDNFEFCLKEDEEL